MEQVFRVAGISSRHCAGAQRALNFLLSIELSYKATETKQRNRSLLSQPPIKRIGYFLFLVGKIKEGPPPVAVATVL
jgi:hypothetical protein